MGGAKRMLEEIEAKRGRATMIALKAGALRECELHDEIFEGQKDVQGAYKLGNAIFEKDSLHEVFDSRRDMTDYIKEVVEEAGDECYYCAKARDE